MAKDIDTEPGQPITEAANDTQQIENTKRTFMYPGDATTPSISVQATSKLEADKLYKTKLKEIK